MGKRCEEELRAAAAVDGGGEALAAR